MFLVIIKIHFVLFARLPQPVLQSFPFFHELTVTTNNILALRNAIIFLYLLFQFSQPNLSMGNILSLKFCHFQPQYFYKRHSLYKNKRVYHQFPMLAIFRDS